MKTCVVTGTTGLIGSALATELSHRGEVIGVSRGNPVWPDGLGKYQHINLDMSGEWDTRSLPDRTDAVIHLAQSDHYRQFPERAEDVFYVNTLSTLKLLDYAKRAQAKTFILASSGGLELYQGQNFSQGEWNPSNENLSFYLGSKLCSEVLAESYSGIFNVVLLRLFFVYGPDQKPDRLIPRLIQSVIDGKPIQLQGEDGIAINPIYVSDAVQSICKALELKRNSAINVAGPQLLSLRAIGELIGDSLNKRPRFAVSNSGPSQNLGGDIIKMSELLGPPKIKFQEGIQRCIEHFLHQKNHGSMPPGRRNT